jgi:hypothetical protein
VNALTSSADKGLIISVPWCLNSRTGKGQRSRHDTRECPRSTRFASHTIQQPRKPPVPRAGLPERKPPPAKNPGRRMAKSRKTRELQGGGLTREHDKRFKNQLKNMDTYINSECIQQCGFISDSKTPIWKNKINALKAIDPAKLELRQPTNLAFHNLSDTKLPTGTKCLLGLSLKFCLEQNRPKHAIETTIQNMKRSIRIRYWLDQQP